MFGIDLEVRAYASLYTSLFAQVFVVGPSPVALRWLRPAV